MSRSQPTPTPNGDEILAEIEKLAAHLLTPAQIGLIIDDEAIAEKLMIPGTMAYRAYQRGKLKTKLELHKSVLQLAKQGSGPAQTLALDMLLDQALGEG